ncbi:MAG: hypothetical protein Q9P44_20330 [Anaerolineae bacterium]|nr:hypothetical protein [Anaerolineae bacterium]
MMKTLKRYTRAFVKAVKMTLEGKAIQTPETHYPNLTKWVQEGLQRLETTLQIADSQNMDEAARKQVIVKIDRRDMSMDVILRAVQHNLSLEYPMLMQATVEHNLTALYALNLNDQYRVSQLAKNDRLAPQVQAAIAQLAAHLQNIPSSNAP